MKSARARPTAKKSAFLECFICGILLCCFPESLRSYKNAEVDLEGALEERNGEMGFSNDVSPSRYTQNVTPCRQFPCSIQNTSARGNLDHGKAARARGELHPHAHLA